MQSDYQANLDVETARKLVDMNNDSLVGAGFLSDTTLGQYNAACSVLKDYITVDFNEQTFRNVINNLVNIFGYSELGIYLDLTQIKDSEKQLKFTDGNGHSNKTNFNNLGISGAVMYYAIGQTNVQMDFTNITTPNAIQQLTIKEQWIREALGQTINPGTGRVSSTETD